MNRQNDGGAGGGGEGAAGKIVASAHQGTVSNQPLPAQLYTSNSMKLPPPKVAPQQIVVEDIEPFINKHAALIEKYKTVVRYTFIATGGISILTAGICILFIWLYVSVTVSFNSVYRDCTGGEWTFERCKPTCVKSNLEDIMKHVIEITKSSSCLNGSTEVANFSCSLDTDRIYECYNEDNSDDPKPFFCYLPALNDSRMGST